MIIWLDLETPDLNPRAEGAEILEISLFCAPDALPCSAVPLYHAVLAADTSDRDAAPERVREMHDKSGLWLECFNSTLTEYEVETTILDVLTSLGKDDYPRFTLAGSSVHFDLKWLEARMPTLAREFSHRLLDVSAIKLFCYGLGMPGLSPPGTEPAHRAYDDVRSSVDHLMRCRRFIERAPLFAGASLWTPLGDHWGRGKRIVREQLATQGFHYGSVNLADTLAREAPKTSAFGPEFYPDVYIVGVHGD